MRNNPGRYGSSSTRDSSRRPQRGHNGSGSSGRTQQHSSDRSDRDYSNGYNSMHDDLESETSQPRSARGRNAFESEGWSNSSDDEDFDTQGDGGVFDDSDFPVSRSSERSNQGSRPGSSQRSSSTRNSPDTTNRSSQSSTYREENVGKGPKNWSRSDARILEEAQENLARDGCLDASELEVKVEKGEVTLSGSVSTRQEKRAAEDCVQDVLGVEHVINQIRVSSQKSHESSKSTKQTAGSSSGA